MQAVLESEYKVSFGIIEDVPELSSKIFKVKASTKVSALKAALRETNCFAPFSIIRYLARIERVQVEDRIDNKYKKVEDYLRGAIKVAGDIPDLELKVTLINKLTEILSLVT